MCPAGPARHPVHHHGARPAHADTTGKPVGQSGINVLLNPRNDIQDCLTCILRHRKGFIVTGVSAATTYRYFYFSNRPGHVGSQSLLDPP